MPHPVAPAAAVHAAVAGAHRREWALVLATVARLTGDLDLAEECVQDAYGKALTVWAADGIPANPAAWLTTTARRLALDQLRRSATLKRKLPLLTGPDARDEPNADVGAWPDDRLRLVFTCCHPALGVEAQVALTLRLLCGLTTAEVARGLLVSEATMAARITRAKKKITAAGIPYRIPCRADLPQRVDAVCHVVYLLYTAGHTAAIGTDLTRPDLTERALDLARMLRLLLPGDTNVAGLLALILLSDARSTTRTDRHGQLQLLADQDRSRWDRAAITEGAALVREALRTRPPGRYALQAAIAAVHAESPSFADTDWMEIVALYDLITVRWPSPVIALNRAVAIGFAHGPAAGLAALDALAAAPQLAQYPYLAAARADFHRRLGHHDDARLAYQEALVLTDNQTERDYLTARMRALP
ncbi:MAG TPA: sigma-70 family RNA polymerase sigma factor [Streptosporangiaceae bacterium]